jgi:hypothetical protein
MPLSSGAANGFTPVSISYITTPVLKRSDRGDTGAVFTCSGDM